MIRQAAPTDIAAIRSLMQSEPGFYKQAARAGALETELASAGDLAVVWEEGGRVLGFACAHDLGFRAYLGELIVAAPSRGRGIGTALVQHIEKTLRDRGCPVLFSDVWTSAAGFYRSLGWSEPDVVLLRKRLAPDAGRPADAAAKETP